MSLPRLSYDDIRSQLDKIPGWVVDGQSIVKRYTFRDFSCALQFVNVLGQTAEAVNHHPDIDIRYNKVIITLSTHEASGITRKDIDLAVAADDYASRIPKQLF
jgi:4a-hydroxytetrahydrobiopterin dehydratase